MNQKKQKWFVVLMAESNMPDRHRPILMTDGFGEDDPSRTAVFKTEEEAIAAAESNPYSRAAGYVIVEWPFDCSKEKS